MLHPISNVLVIPDSDMVRSRFQSLAMLDAILMADWEFRYFSFNAKWGAGEMMASMRNGAMRNIIILRTPLRAQKPSDTLILIPKKQ